MKEHIFIESDLIALALKFNGKPRGITA